jgi:hypothetical protein
MPDAPTTQTLPPQVLLPPAEKLDALERAIHAFIEDEIEPITRSVFSASNYEDEQEVTFEDVGRLVTWARDVRRFHIEPLLEHLQNLEEAVLDDLPNIVHAGKQELAPKFDKRGYRRDYEREYAAALRGGKAGGES